MKKPVKKYEDINSELQITNSETEEMFYMCEFIDAYAAKPNRQETKDLEIQIN